MEVPDPSKCRRHHLSQKTHIFMSLFVKRFSLRLKAAVNEVSPLRNSSCNKSSTRKLSPPQIYDPFFRDPLRATTESCHAAILRRSLLRTGKGRRVAARSFVRGCVRMGMRTPLDGRLCHIHDSCWLTRGR